MELLIYQLIRVPVISVRYLCLIKRCSMQFCMVYQTKSNVHLLCPFIHVFIYNSITKCFWQLPNLWQRHLEKPLSLHLISQWSLVLGKFLTNPEQCRFQLVRYSSPSSYQSRMANMTSVAKTNWQFQLTLDTGNSQLMNIDEKRNGTCIFMP